MFGSYATGQKTLCGLPGCYHYVRALRQLTFEDVLPMASVFHVLELADPLPAIYSQAACRDDKVVRREVGRL